ARPGGRDIWSCAHFVQARTAGFWVGRPPSPPRIERINQQGSTTQGHGGEVLRRERAGDQPLDLGAHHDRGRAVRERQAGQVILGDLAVDLLDHLYPCILIGFGVRVLQGLGEIIGERVVLGGEGVVLLHEEGADEVVRRVVVTGPPQQEGVCL